MAPMQDQSQLGGRPVRSRQRFVRSTEDRVRVAAVRLFARRGFAATGIRDIAREAQMTSATLYHYTTSKEQLLLDVMEQGQSELNVISRSVCESISEPERRLGGLVGVLVATHATNPMSTRVVDTEIRVLEPGSAARQLIVSLRDEYESLWQETLDSGCASGVFNVQNTHVTRLALIAMCTGMSGWFDPDGPMNVASIREQFVDLAMALVRARRDGRAVEGKDIRSVDFAEVPLYPWEPAGERG